MTRTCDACLAVYNDALSTTICPHERFLSDEEAARKDAAGKLLGKRVVFRHRPPGVDPARVNGYDRTGMVSLDGWSGSFAPHVFEVVEDQTNES